MIDEKISTTLTQLEYELTSIKGSSEKLKQIDTNYTNIGDAVNDVAKHLNEISSKVNDLINKININYSQKISTFDKKKEEIEASANKVIDNLSVEVETLKVRYYCSLVLNILAILLMIVVAIRVW